MSRQYFLCSDSVQPARRWQTAFPHGVACDRDGILRAAAAGDPIWLSTALPDWEGELRGLAARLTASPLAVLSLAPDDEEGLRALEGGARAYCHALAVPELFREVAEVLRHGGLWIGAGLMGRVVGAARKELAPADGHGLHGVLSPREIEVARAAANGASNREIAEALGITERTVKAHLGAVFGKLGVRDRLQLVLRLSKQGVPVGVA